MARTKTNTQNDTKTRTRRIKLALNPQKIDKKVSQWIPVPLGMLNNILKI